MSWNKGLKISGMSGKKQSEKQKEITRKRDIEDNPAKRPEVKKKMKLAALNRKIHPNLGKHWKVKDTSKMGIKGKNHWKWIFDRTKLAKHQVRNDMAYKEWRKEVYKKDNWKCRINNKNCSGRIIAHHILSWSEYPELRYKVNNGITLCQAHHPRKRAEEKRLISFFKKLVSVSSR